MKTALLTIIFVIPTSVMAIDTYSFHWAKIDEDLIKEQLSDPFDIDLNKIPEVEDLQKASNRIFEEMLTSGLVNRAEVLHLSAPRLILTNRAFSIGSHVSVSAVVKNIAIEGKYEADEDAFTFLFSEQIQHHKKGATKFNQKVHSIELSEEVIDKRIASINFYGRCFFYKEKRNNIFVLKPDERKSHSSCPLESAKVVDVRLSVPINIFQPELVWESNDLIFAIIAHEMGHYVKGHGSSIDSHFFFDLNTYAQTGQIIRVENDLTEKLKFMGYGDSNETELRALARKSGLGLYSSEIEADILAVRTLHKFGIKVEPFIEWILRRSAKDRSTFLSFLDNHSRTEKGLAFFTPDDYKDYYGGRLYRAYMVHSLNNRLNNRLESPQLISTDRMTKLRASIFLKYWDLDNKKMCRDLDKILNSVDVREFLITLRSLDGKRKIVDEILEKYERCDGSTLTPEILNFFEPLIVDKESFNKSVQKCVERCNDY